MAEDTSAGPAERTHKPKVGDERQLMLAFLDFHRATLELKCSGLTDDQLRTRTVDPSDLSLLGLVRHLTDVERSWFRRIIAQADAPRIYYSDENPDGFFNDLDEVPVQEVLARWHRQIEESRQTMVDRSLDDTTLTRFGEIVSVRWIILHMIEEYARHNGHADLIRERIDGARGE